MAQIFPKWTNKLPLIITVKVVLILAFVVFFFWYWGSPSYTDVGYVPRQPIPYSHKLHVGDLGMDCRYCHSQVEYSNYANIPAVSVCMNCHTLIGSDKESLEPLRQAWAEGKPIEWVKVHKLPDFAYFNHAAHIRVGVSCVSCHGNVGEMEEIMQVEKLSMGWCLECHRNPYDHLRPVEEVTNMNWTPPEDHAQFIAELKKQKKINPPENCSACHR